MVNRQLFRVGAINSIREASTMQSCRDSGVKDYIKGFCKTMKDFHKSSKDVYIQNMIQDFDGQIKEALNITTRGAQENWYDRWGRHYLLSLMGAYTNEICNNFKDKGIWNFKSPMFDRLWIKFQLFEAIHHLNLIVNITATSKDKGRCLFCGTICIKIL